MEGTADARQPRILPAAGNEFAWFGWNANLKHVRSKNTANSNFLNECNHHSENVSGLKPRGKNRETTTHTNVDEPHCPSNISNLILMICIVHRLVIVNFGDNIILSDIHFYMYISIHINIFMYRYVYNYIYMYKCISVFFFCF